MNCQSYHQMILLSNDYYEIITNNNKLLLLIYIFHNIFLVLITANYANKEITNELYNKGNIIF